MELTEEQLKQMTPEQLQELQKANCIFCHISNGKVQSKKVYEDDICMAVLDINPANPGHILLFPKEHFSILPQVPEDVLARMSKVSKDLSAASLRALKTQGTNIIISNGVAAGQKAPHVLFHIIPRDEKDGLKCFDLDRKPSHDDPNELSKRLRLKLNALMGIQEKSPIEIDRKDDGDKPPEPKVEEKEETPPEPDEKAEPAEPQDDNDEQPPSSLDVDNIAKVLGLG